MENDQCGQAKALALNYFNDPKTGELGLVEGDVYAIKDKDTIEKTYGWIFNCNSRLYFETGNQRYLAIGHGPVVVEKHDGSVRALATRFDREVHIKLYEIDRWLDKWPLPIWMREAIINVYVWLEYRKHGRSET